MSKIPSSSGLNAARRRTAPCWHWECVLLPAAMRNVLIGLSLLLLVGKAMAQQPTNPVAEEARAEVRDAASYFAELDDLYRRRDQAQAPARIEQLIAAASKAYPEEPGMLWRAARWQFWKADTAESDRAKEGLAKTGWELAERAVKKEPNSIEARYWAAVNCGTYGDAIGVLNALSKGIEGKFRGNLDFVVEKQPGFENSGPLLTLGRYYGKLPWPKRDRKKAVENLRGAIKLSPKNLRARVFLAEVLLDDGQAKEALKVIDEVLAPGAGGNDIPEDGLMLKLARALKPKIEEELK